MNRCSAGSEPCSLTPIPHKIRYEVRVFLPPPDDVVGVPSPPVKLVRSSHAGLEGGLQLIELNGVSKGVRTGMEKQDGHVNRPAQAKAPGLRILRPFP